MDDAAAPVDGGRARRFDAAHARALMLELASAPDAMDAAAFIDAGEEIRGLVTSLGGVFSFAATEIKEKLTVVRARVAEMHADSRPSVQALVLWEVARHTERQHDRGDASAARSVLRLMWLFDYVDALLTSLLVSAPAVAAADSAPAVDGDGAKPAPATMVTEAPALGTCARAAYAATLAPRHPLLLREAVRAATLLLPSRASFLRMLEDGHPHDELEPALRDFVAALGVVRGALWAFFRAHELDSLP